MLSQYFEGYEVKPEFEKEYISIFNGWLGTENLDKLDQVTELEWSKFNTLLKLVFEKYKCYEVDLNKESCTPVNDLGEITSTYKQYTQKAGDMFLKLVIPELGAVLSEDWDYTYIFWHKNNGAKEQIASLVKKAGLKQFSDESKIGHTS